MPELWEWLCTTLGKEWVCQTGRFAINTPNAAVYADRVGAERGGEN